MFAKALGPVLLAAGQILIPFGHVKNVERPRAPIEETGPLWAARCDGSTDAAKPSPVRIHGNAYLVGSCGASSVLIVSEQGDILIDGGNDGELVANNIRDLGFGPEDIRYILASGAASSGTATLQRLSGATVIGSAVRDGEELRMGNLMVVAIVSPGQPLSWRWVSCDGGVCRMIVYADVVAPASRADSSAYRAAVAKIAASPCEILVTRTPSASGMPHRLALGRPLFDADACKTYAESLTQRLDDRLAKEAPPK